MRKAFTIVELMVALAISIVLVAIALPGYNQYSRQQDLNMTSENIVGCLQRAQSIAASPLSTTNTPTVRYVEALLIYSMENHTISCTNRSYSDELATPTTILNQSAQPLTGSNQIIWSGVDLSEVTVPDASPSTLNNPSIVQVVFDVLGKGVPLLYEGCTGTGCTKIIPPASDYSHGFNMILTITDQSGTTQDISMGRLGVPIQLQNL